MLVKPGGLLDSYREGNFHAIMPLRRQGGDKFGKGRIHDKGLVRTSSVSQAEKKTAGEFSMMGELEVVYHRLKFGNELCSPMNPMV